jgi:putative membrane protein
VHSAGGLGALLVLGIATGYTVLAGSSTRGWSRWRTASFLTGCVLLMLALAPGQDGSFATHMRQHLLIGMLAPTALVLGAPVTLLLRTLPVAAGRRLGRVFRVRAVRFLTHPVTALILAVGPLPLLYLTPLHARIGGSPLLHLHFLLAGYLFAWVVAGPDPAPHRPGVPARLVVLGVAVAVHAVLSQVLYAGVVDLPVAAADRRAGATLMYYGGDLAELLLAVALVASWRSDHRRPRADARPATRSYPERARLRA